MPDWFKLIAPAVTKAWDAVLTLFEQHPIRIAAAGTLLVSAIVTGNFYVDRIRQYQAIVSTTVRAETEDTPQRFKVLEAFIMSTIDANLSATIQKAQISTAFRNRLNQMHTVLAEPAPRTASESGLQTGDASPQKTAAATVSLSIPGYVSKVQDLPSRNAILTDDAEDGYLFFPLNLLRARLDGKSYDGIFNESKSAGRSPTLATAVGQDPAIADDIAVTRRLLPTMKDFTLDPLFENAESLGALAAEQRPVQIYYITKNGLNRIVNNQDAAGQRIVYRNMFRSTTFFPSRPYFVGAFHDVTPGVLKDLAGPVKSSFYVSKPYLDIGGFGIVITIARPVRYEQHSDAAVCFDLRVRLDNDVIVALKRRLQSFGSTPQDVECHIGFHGDVQCPPANGSNVEFQYRKTLEDSLTSTMGAGDLSTVVGNISLLDANPPSPALTHAAMADFLTYPAELVFGYNARAITFAIPSSSPKAASDGKALTAQFMIASLNLERFQEVTTLLGLVSFTLLASAFFLVIFSWQGEMRARHNYQDAFETVDAVLYGAPTPYCRLDAHDAIVDCNTAFCDLLTMPADKQSIQSLKGQTFESLLATRSKGTYHDVQQRRRTRRDVPPYTLYFRQQNGNEIETRVTSGVIPGRTPRELPETFGIAIPTLGVVDGGVPQGASARLVADTGGIRERV